MMEESIGCGMTGTALGAVATGLSINEVQAIVSIVIMVLSFLVGVVWPLVSSFVKKVKKAKEDGVVTKEERDELFKDAKDGVQKIADGTKEVLDEVNKKIEEMHEDQE